jgi:hypothetical protein
MVTDITYIIHVYQPLPLRPMWSLCCLEASYMLSPAARLMAAAVSFGMLKNGL